MATTSTRLAFRKPQSSDPISVEDDFQDNWAVTERYPGVRICTRFSRPVWGATQAGMAIYETDTAQLLRWSGSEFVRFADSGWSTQIALSANTGGWPLIALPKNSETIVLQTAFTTNAGVGLAIRATGGNVSAPSVAQNQGAVKFTLTTSIAGGPSQSSLFNGGDSIALSLLATAPTATAPTVPVTVTLFGNARFDSCVLLSAPGSLTWPQLVLSVEEI